MKQEFHSSLSYWPIRVFILDLVHISGVLIINSFNKKFIIALVRDLTRISFFNFMYFLTNIWAAKFEMILFIANISKFSVSCEFASGMWTNAKFTFFIKPLVFRMWVLWLDLLSFLWKSLSMLVVVWDLRMLTCLLNSIACTNCFRLNEAAFLMKPFRKGVISCASYNHILD